MKTYDLLEINGWTVECESPFEIRHNDGSFATGQAARMVNDSLSSELDLDRISMNRIIEAAERSNWMPEEYCMNDWVSDVCKFLREGK